MVLAAVISWEWEALSAGGVGAGGRVQASAPEQEVGVRGSRRDGRAHHPPPPGIGHHSGWPRTNETARGGRQPGIGGSRGWAGLPKAVSHSPPQLALQRDMGQRRGH